MRIVSWNIQWGRGIDGRVDLTRMAAVAREYDADIYCLQEVAVNHPQLPGGAAMDQVAWLSGLFLGYEAIYGIASDLGDGHGGRRCFGNLILSRLPVLQAFRYLLPWPPDPAVPSMPRVAVETVIEAPTFPGGALRVITTHLEYYSAIQRAAQVAALRRICDEGWEHSQAPRSADETDPPFAVLPRGEGVVLCGDFNCVGGPVELQLLTQASGAAPPLIDAWPIAHPAVPHAPTVGVHEISFSKGPQTYDYFFVSGNIASRVKEVTVDPDTDASDHQPAILDLVD